jgi:hypothetical protein
MSRQLIVRLSNSSSPICSRYLIEHRQLSNTRWPVVRLIYLDKSSTRRYSPTMMVYVFVRICLLLAMRLDDLDHGTPRRSQRTSSESSRRSATIIQRDMKPRRSVICKLDPAGSMPPTYRPRTLCIYSSERSLLSNSLQHHKPPLHLKRKQSSHHPPKCPPQQQQPPPPQTSS